MDVGLNDTLPEYAHVKAGIAAVKELAVTAPALVVYGFSFGTHKDDIIRLEIEGPEGTILTEDRQLTRRHAQAFRAVGKRRKSYEDWPAGTYTGTATLLRNSDVISSQQTVITVK